MRQRLQSLEIKVTETKGVQATTPQKAKGDGKKQPALKTVLKKGTAAAGKKAHKAKGQDVNQQHATLRKLIRRSCQQQQRYRRQQEAARSKPTKIFIQVEKERWICDTHYI
jgi:hypothetical protein